MIQTLVNNLDKIYAILTMFSFSLTVRFIMQFVGQKWVTTTSHTATLVFLPILTYVITNVISGNIALSLGMVGALSIVRFRNPVRSPLELTLYFGAITMGIAASVNLKWLALLMIATIISVVGLVVLQILFKKMLNVSFFSYSFSEGNSMSTLIVKTKQSIDYLEKNNLLNNMVVDQDCIAYTLISGDFQQLKSISSKVNDMQNTISINLSR